jgi:hypothetical protein
VGDAQGDSHGRAEGPSDLQLVEEGVTDGQHPPWSQYKERRLQPGFEVGLACMKIHFLYYIQSDSCRTALRRETDKEQRAWGISDEGADQCDGIRE